MSGEGSYKNTKELNMREGETWKWLMNLPEKDFYQYFLKVMREMLIAQHQDAVCQ